MRRDSQHRHRGGMEGSAGDKQGIDPVLVASVRAMDWRLAEAAARIGEASDAIGRGQAQRAMERLFDIEPLIFEAQRILSGVFVLIGERIAGNWGGSDPD
jgi:hypothetical protein